MKKKERIERIEQILDSVIRTLDDNDEDIDHLLSCNKALRERIEYLEDAVNFIEAQNSRY